MKRTGLPLTRIAETTPRVRGQRVIPSAGEFGGAKAMAFAEQRGAMLSSVPNSDIAAIIEAIRPLIAKPATPGPEIRFHVRETAPAYRSRGAK